jgi:hypothetical protein
MSGNERHRLRKRAKILCAACQARKARFRYRGEVRADRDHTLCFECHRNEVNRARARRLSEGVAPLVPPAPRSPFGPPPVASGPALTHRQIAHRQRMLDHLQRTHAVAS